MGRGLGRLPVWVVSIRSVLRFMAREVYHRESQGGVPGHFGWEEIEAIDTNFGYNPEVSISPSPYQKLRSFPARCEP